MNRLLTYCYFCPAAQRRPGGVQQILEPLLSQLAEEHDWKITVLHSGACAAPSRHVDIPEPESTEEPLAIEPELLCENARRVREAASNHDVVLSIDRLLPGPLAVPCVLMSNTLAYFTEASAVQGDQWRWIVAPTNRHAELVKAVNPRMRVAIVAYGLPKETFAKAQMVPSPVCIGDSCVIRLPHRPDRRKGHREAIEGLARALPASKNVTLEISWLGEDRYSSYKKELENLAAGLGVGAQISFSCWRDGDDEWQASVRSCAMLQLGCFEESFGLSIVRSILLGRPAVTRRQPAVREVVGPTDLLIEIINPLDWHHTLRTYLSRGPDQALFERQQACQSLTFEAMALGYDRILKDAVFSA